MVKSKKAIAKIADDLIEASQGGSTQGRPKALVFISHDTRNANLAEAFGNLLSDVSGGTLKSFRSSDKKGNTGIEFGAEWFSTIMAQLDDATDVVALLTPQSLDRPWILYEAGVAKGKLDTTLFGLALGVPLEKVSVGPFGQFQNSDDEEDSLTKLVMQLLSRNPDAEPREEAVRAQVKVFKEKVLKILASSPKPKAAETEGQNIAKLFEEVKAMVKEIPEQLEGRTQLSNRRGGRRSRRLDAGFISHMLDRFSDEEMGGPVGAFQMVLSFLKEDFPWLYESGNQVINAYTNGDKKTFEQARNRFMQSMDYLSRSKIAYEVLGDERDVHSLREFTSMFGNYLFHGPLSEVPSKAKSMSTKTGRKARFI